MQKIFIKPRIRGQIIRHPEKMQHIISQDGEWVVDSTLWQRKLLKGDVVITTPPETASIKPAAKQKSKQQGDE
jgi:hypothetical protein